MSQVHMDKCRGGLVPTLLFATLLAVGTAYLCLVLYCHADYPLLDSDICCWMAIDRQIFDAFPNVGKIVMAHYRASLELLFAFPFMLMFGCTTFSAFLANAFLAAAAICVLALCMSLRRSDDGSRLVAAPLRMAAIALGGFAIYPVNCGHCPTYLFASLAWLLSVHRLGALRLRCAMLFILSFLGWMSDDMFAVVGIVPMAALGGYRWLMSRRVPVDAASVAIGAAFGRFFAKCLVWWGVWDHPVLHPSILPVNMWHSAAAKAGATFLELFCHGDAGGASKTLGLLMIVLAGGSLLYSTAMLVRKRESATVLLPPLCGTIALTLSYSLLGTECAANSLEVVPRYLFWAGVCMVSCVAPLLHSRSLSVRVAVTVFFLCFAANAFQVQFWSKRGNAGCRSDMKDLSAHLVSNGASRVCAEWWTAYALECAAGNALRVRPMPTGGTCEAGDRHLVCAGVFSEPMQAVVIPLCTQLDATFAANNVVARFGPADKVEDFKGFRIMYYRNGITFSPANAIRSFVKVNET